jgi:hypothetical protein
MSWIEESGFDSLKEQEFSLLYSDQTNSGAHQASYTVGAGGCFPFSKAAAA